MKRLRWLIYWLLLLPLTLILVFLEYISEELSMFIYRGGTGSFLMYELSGLLIRIGDFENDKKG